MQKLCMNFKAAAMRYVKFSKSSDTISIFNYFGFLFNRDCWSDHQGQYTDLFSFQSTGKLHSLHGGLSYSCEGSGRLTLVCHRSTGRNLKIKLGFWE